MARVSAERTFAARALIAGAVIGLFVLLGLVLAAAPHHGGAAAGVAVSFGGEFCSQREHGDGKTPSPVHNHAQCCILCAANGYGLFGHAAAPADFVVLPPREPVPADRRRSAEAPGHPPLGFATSWSSRAPPSFS